MGRGSGLQQAGPSMHFAADHQEIFPGPALLQFAVGQRHPSLARGIYRGQSRTIFFPREFHAGHPRWRGMGISG